MKLLACFCYFQELSTPRKRKQTTPEMDTNINLTPRKKLHTELPPSPVKDSPRKSSLRLKLQTQTQTNSVRMSPRNSTPSRAQRSAETPGKSPKVQQTEDEAHVKQKDRKDLKTTELQRDADVLLTINSCNSTQVPVLLKL